MKKIYSIVVCLILSCICSSYSFAKLSVEPRLSLSETYNDNIFLENKGSDSDWITTLSPGFRLVYDAKELRADLDYALNFIKYAKYSEKDESSFRDVQRTLGEALFFPDRDLTLALRGEISRVVIDERVQSVAENEFLNKVTLYHLTANPQYQWRVLPTFRTILGYRYDNYHYVADGADDSETHHYSLSMVKDLATGTKVKLTLFHEKYQSKTEEDYQIQQVSAGVTQQVGPKWSINAEAGLARVDFDSRQASEDSTWSVEVAGQLAKYLKLVLASDLAFSVSVNDGLTKRTQASVAILYQKFFNVELGADWNESRYQTEDRLDKSFGGILKGGIPLSRTIVLSADGNVRQFKFSPVEEKVLRFGVGSTLEYVGKRGSLALRYVFRNSDSDIEANDYTNNIVSLSGSLRF